MFAKAFFDCPRCILTTRIEVAEMIDKARLLDGRHIVAGRVKKCFGGVATRDHERHVIFGSYWQDHARERATWYGRRSSHRAAVPIGACRRDRSEPGSSKH